MTDLSKDQRGLLMLISMGWTIQGPRPGWNQLIEADFAAHGIKISCSGEELNDLFGRGYLEARPAAEVKAVMNGEGEELDLTHQWFLTNKGRAALAN